MVIVAALLVVGVGTTVGLAAIGVVSVPFLFAKKKGPPPPKDDGKGGPFAPFLATAAGFARLASASEPPKSAAPPPAPPDTGPGEAKLAGLWAEMPTDRLATIVDKWPPPQLGRILASMDDEAVTNLLAALPPARATALSRLVAAATDEKALKVHPNEKK